MCNKPITKPKKYVCMCIKIFTCAYVLHTLVCMCE